MYYSFDGANEGNTMGQERNNRLLLDFFCTSADRLCGFDISVVLSKCYVIHIITQK